LLLMQLLVRLEQMFVLLMVLFLQRMRVRMCVWVGKCVLLERRARRGTGVVEEHMSAAPAQRRFQPTASISAHATVSMDAAMSSMAAAAATKTERRGTLQGVERGQMMTASRGTATIGHAAPPCSVGATVEAGRGRHARVKRHTSSRASPAASDKACTSCVVMVLQRGR
jgi:hypothetical protein